MLLYPDSIYDKSISNRSSAYAGMLITRYLDSDEDGITVAKMMFVYGDKEFTPERSKKKNSSCDHYAEAVCTGLAEQYFSSRENNEYRYYIDDDESLFRLLTEGIPVLSEKMEILATDRFSRKTVLRPASSRRLPSQNRTGMRYSSNSELFP